MRARLIAAVALACSLAPGMVAAQAAGAAAPAASAPLAPAPAASAPAAASVPAASAPLAPGPAASASAPAASVPATAEPQASVPVVAAPAPVATLPAATAVPAAPGPMAGPSAGNLLQTIFALTLVLALLGAMVWFMKRFGPQAAAGAAQMRTIGALSLGGRERVIVIEVGDQWIVVGASPGRINALATMPKQETPGGPAVLANGPASGTFAEWLKQTIDKRNGR